MNKRNKMNEEKDKGFFYPMDLWQKKNKDLYKEIPEYLKENHRFDKKAMLDIILKREIDLDNYKKKKYINYESVNFLNSNVLQIR
jgi:hypothetical protein